MSYRSMNHKRKGLMWLKLMSCVFVLLILLQNVAAKAQHFAVISGEISEVDNSKVFDKFLLKILTGRAGDLNFPLDGSYETYPIVVAKGKFLLKVPLVSEISYVQLYIINGVNFLSRGFFLVVPGDSLHIKINKDSFYITGSNQKFIDFELDCFNDLGSFQSLPVSVKTISALFSMADSLINKYCSRLDSVGIQDQRLKDVLLVNVKAMYQKRLLSKLVSKQFTTDTLLLHTIKVYMDLLGDDIAIPAIPFTIEHSLYNTDLILYYQQLKLAFFADKSEPKFDQLYFEIANAYVGLLRDRLIALLFWSINYTFKSGNADILISPAIDLVEDSSSKAVLIKLKEAKYTGNKAYNFNLEDVNGNFRSLNEFRGKTIVCHFWFTKCFACNILSEFLAPVIESYRGNPYVVFINVNVDNERDEWLSGLNKGDFTHPAEISLFTGGLGAQHPFVKYYNYMGFPQLLLIDVKGNVISSNPDQPRNQESAEAFKMYLNKFTKN